MEEIPSTYGWSKHLCFPVDLDQPTMYLSESSVIYMCFVDDDNDDDDVDDDDDDDGGGGSGGVVGVVGLLVVAVAAAVVVVTVILGMVGLAEKNKWLMEC